MYIDINKPERRGLSLKSLSFDATRQTRVANNTKTGMRIFLAKYGLFTFGDKVIQFLKSKDQS